MLKTSINIKKDIIVGQSGKPKGVYLSMSEFKKIQKVLKDVSDIHWIQQYRHEEKDAVSWNEVKQRLEKDELI